MSDNKKKTTITCVDELKEVLNKRWAKAAAEEENVKTKGIDVEYRTFHLFDKNNSDSLTKPEFERLLQTILNNHQPPISTEECDTIFNEIDTNKNGLIVYDEFIAKLHPTLSKNRLIAVRNVFRKLDKNMSGAFTCDDMDVSKHPDVLSGKRLKKEVAEQFLRFVIGTKHNIGRPEICEREFINYYTDLSTRIPTDEHFVSMIYGAWDPLLYKPKTVISHNDTHCSSYY